MKKLFLLLFAFLSAAYLNAQCWKLIAAGAYHNLAIREDGTLWVWGSIQYGPLGTDHGDYREPTKIGTDSNWSLLSPGAFYSIAQKRNGELWSWGRNASGELGNGTNADNYFPELMNSISNVQSMSGRGSFSQAIKSDSTIWAWGYNSHGELGDGTYTDKWLPEQIGNDRDWKYVTTGYYRTLAIKYDGTLWGWFGEHAIWTGFVNMPVNIFTGNDWKTAATGYLHSLAIKNDGSLWAWGNNRNGQLGDGTYTTRDSPIQIGSDYDWLSVVAGAENSFAIKKDSSLWAWGYNANGELGDGTSSIKLTPVKIDNLRKWKSVSPGSEHTIALASDNTLWTWGANNSGQLGDGTTISHILPANIGCGNPLPITLSSFILQKNKDNVLLNWQTQTELQGKEFQIERCADGITFKVIGIIRATNNETGSSYSFVDEKPLRGFNYYRLKNMDVDGKFSYSVLKMCTFSSTINEVFVYPNPARNSLTIESNFVGQTTINITDIAGRQIWRAVKGNSFKQELPIAGWKAGVYLVTVTDNSTTVTKKIIKQ